MTMPNVVLGLVCVALIVVLAVGCGKEKTEDHAALDTKPPVTVADPPGGTYSSAVSVKLTSNEPSSIYYTTDGRKPTALDYDGAGWSPLSGIEITTDTTLKFFAVDTAGHRESVKIQTYVISAGPDVTPPTTTAYPPGGTYDSAVSATLTPDEAATVYYTMDGSTPDVGSAVYTSPIDINTDTTLKFFAVDTAGNGESVKTEEYVIEIITDTTPPITVAAPAGGTYDSVVTVTLTSNEPATVYYTVDGTEPTMADYDGTGASPLSGIEVLADTTLKFFGVDMAGNEESVRVEEYTIGTGPDTTPPVTVATPPGGTYDSSVTVTLTSNEPSTIYYTTDGREPIVSDWDGTGASPLSGITISSDASLKFFAVDTAENEESVKTQVYDINIMGIYPSHGSGGTISPGSTGTWDAGGGMDPLYVRIPTSYSPETLASPVVWLCKEQMWRWTNIADDNNLVLVDLNEDNNGNNYAAKILYAYQKLEKDYNVDWGRYYMAGWSAGGNFAIQCTDINQHFIAAVMTFPGWNQEVYVSPPTTGRAAKYYYAVGDKDTGYYAVVPDEVAWRQSVGYTVRLDVVPNGGHGLPDSKRLDAWNWVKDFNLKDK